MALQSLCLPAIQLKSPSSVCDFASSEFLCGQQQGFQSSLLLIARSPVPSRRCGGRRRTLVRGKLPKKDPGYGLKDYGIPAYKTPAYGIPKPPFKSTRKKSVEAAPVVGKGPSSSSKNLETPSFWNYAAPGDYSAPGNYAAPKAYAAPSGYGPNGSVAANVAVVEVDAGEVAAGLEGVSPAYQDASVNAELREVEPELGGGDGGAGKEGGGGGGGGGDRGKGDGKGEGEGEEQSEKKMSMSQKLTLAYAALIGVGGVIGFAKSGSVKSLATGGGAALALYYVYAQLPINPVFASSFGLGISAVLLGIMGPRFKKSGKFMPAGVVALFSLIMTGGYLHGIMKSH